MLTIVTDFLLVFYAGASVMTAMAWLSAWRGRVTFSALRDLTGIADRAVLRRFFGLADGRGAYQVALADVLRRRRRAGVILSDVPVHLCFFLALIWGHANLGTPSAAAIACVAGLHAAVVATAALFIAAGSRQTILP